MAYKDHPQFTLPEQDLVIWRYLDFTKYLSMLHDRSLFFCRLDKMFDDALEGSLPRRSYERIQSAWIGSKEKQLEFYERVIADSEESEAFAEIIRQLRERDRPPNSEFIEAQRTWSAVNCWHINDHESAAMWKVYLQTAEGVAVKSTVGRLAGAVASIAEDVMIGTVSYLDFDTDDPFFTNAMAPLMTKRRSFAYEQELRVLIWRGMKGAIHLTDGLGACSANSPWGPVGLNLEVDVDCLIESVVVHPAAPDWFMRLTTDITRSLGFRFAIDRSGMSSSPLF